MGRRTLIVDTNVLLFVDQGEALEREATAKIAAASATGMLYVSAISAWEIATLIRRGRMRVVANAAIYVKHLLELQGVQEVPVTAEIACAAGSLTSELHGDPADRIIIATALTLNLPLVTRDRNIINFAKAHGGFSCVVA